MLQEESPVATDLSVDNTKSLVESSPGQLNCSQQPSHFPKATVKEEIIESSPAEPNDSQQTNSFLKTRVKVEIIDEVVEENHEETEESAMFSAGHIQEQILRESDTQDLRAGEDVPHENLSPDTNASPAECGRSARCKVTQNAEEVPILTPRRKGRIAKSQQSEKGRKRKQRMPAKAASYRETDMHLSCDEEEQQQQSKDVGRKNDPDFSLEYDVEEESDPDFDSENDDEGVLPKKRITRIKRKPIPTRIVNKIKPKTKVKVKNIENKGTTSLKDKNDVVSKKRFLVSKVYMKNVCPTCGIHVDGKDCPVDKPAVRVLDKRVYEDDNVNSEATEAYAIRTTPSMVEIVHEEGKKDQIYALQHIKKCTLFGPLMGASIEERDLQPQADTSHIWLLDADLHKHVRNSIYMSTEDPAVSNWLRYMQPADTLVDANVRVVEKEAEIYFLVVKSIQPQEKLLYWFSPAFAAKCLPNSFERVGYDHTCSRCCVHFHHFLAYGRHLQIFHPDMKMKMRYPCALCGKVLLGRLTAQRHVRTFHQGAAALKCPHCDTLCIGPDPLRHHIRMKHLAPQQFICEQCGKICPSKQTLNGHKRKIHSLVKEKCEVCNKWFRPDILKRHMRIHSKDFRHTCDQCGKLLHDAYNLKVHMLTHSGVKPFLCSQPDCTASYTTKQCLQSHYRKAHGFSTTDMPAIKRQVPFTFEAHSKSSMSMEEFANSKQRLLAAAGPHTLDMISLAPPTLAPPIKPQEEGAGDNMDVMVYQVQQGVVPEPQYQWY